MSDKPEQPPAAPRRKLHSPVTRAAIAVGVVAILLVVLLAAGGSDWLAQSYRNDNDSEPAAVDPPEVVAITPSSDRIVPLLAIDITCRAAHEAPDSLTYEWSATDGAISGGGSEIRWTAPDAEGLYRVFVTVTDMKGGTDDGSLVLTVRKNTPPEVLSMIAEVGEDPGWVIPGATVRITCDAQDPDGDDLTYEWSATAGTITGHGPLASWTAPDETGMHWLTVVATDVYGGSAKRAIPVTVSRGEPPSIKGLRLEAIDTHEFTQYRDDWRILAERKCAIEVLVADENGDYTYEWSSDRGTIAGDGPNAVWQAPASGTSTIVVRVINSSGAASSTSVRIVAWSFSSCCG